MRHRLGRIEVPGAGEAEERALRVTKAAYAQREPVARVSRGRRPGIALLAAAAVVGAAFIAVAAWYGQDFRRLRIYGR